MGRNTKNDTGVKTTNGQENGNACYYHSYKNAITVCEICRKAICMDCMIQTDDNKTVCQSCYDSKLSMYNPKNDKRGIFSSIKEKIKSMTANDKQKADNVTAVSDYEKLKSDSEQRWNEAQGRVTKNNYPGYVRKNENRNVDTTPKPVSDGDNNNNVRPVKDLKAMEERFKNTAYLNDLTTFYHEYKKNAYDVMRQSAHSSNALREYQFKNLSKIASKYNYNMLDVSQDFLEISLTPGFN